MRVLTLFTRYGLRQYPHAEEKLNDLYERRFPGIERETVVVDAQLPESYRQDTIAGRTVIGGDNSCSEWSAADSGIRFIGSRIWSYDVVNFVTSAFDELYTAYLERFDERIVRLVADGSRAVGHIDYYNEPVRIFSFDSQYWLRTSFLMLPPAELLALRTLCPVRNKSLFFTGDPQMPIRGDAPLSATYVNYLVSWLTGGDIGQGVTWHSGFSLTKETIANFERKSLAIFNEHLLSVRLRERGCAIVDVTWLNSRLSNAGEASIAWKTPWKQQLAERDVDAAVVA